MTTKLDRDVRRVGEFKGSLLSLYNVAISLGYSHEAILKRKERMYNNPAYGKLPRWAKSQIDGYDHGLLDAHYRHLSWVLRYEGALVFSKNVPEGMMHKVNGGTFVYTSFFEKGEIKEF